MTGVNNSLLMKEKNRKRVLSLIREKEQSRADISRSTGLSRAAVTLIVDALIKEGLISEGESVKSDTGRRPTMLRLCPEAYISVGIDLSRAGIDISFVNFASQTVFETSVEFCDTADLSISVACECIKNELNNRFVGRAVLGLGVCCPGPIDSERGIILNPPGLEAFHGYDIKNAIFSRLGIQALLQKDTNALAVCEKNSLSTDGDMIYLLADHGIGCGVIKEGRLFGAKGGMGCEIGHVTLKYDGERCRCGNVGCAELYASIPAILKSAESTFGETIDWYTLVDMASKGIEPAKNLTERYADMLATVCVGAVNLFEPELIVLGGELKHAEHLLAKSIEQRLKNATLSRSKSAVSVIGTLLGERARAHAAAELVIENYFVGE